MINDVSAYFELFKNLFSFPGSFRFKLHGRQRDVDLYEKVTARLAKDRLSGRETTKLLFRLFERGIGFHHPALNSRERGAVEILFRSKSYSKFW